MNKNPILTALLAVGALALFIFVVGIISPETYAEWKQLTFHEPAHFIFEWQNEVLVAAVLIPVWQHAKRKAVREAIQKHDDKFHPHSHSTLDLTEGQQ